MRVILTLMRVILTLMRVIFTLMRKIFTLMRVILIRYVKLLYYNIRPICEDLDAIVSPQKIIQ
jgi:hypothetical protein